MDEEGEQVKTKDLKFTKIVVEGKGRIGKKPNRVSVVLSDQLLQFFEGKVLKLNAVISRNIWNVIKLEGDLESIGIGDQGDGHHQADG